MTSRSRARVVIDVRMAGDSGIGTYIRNVVPRVVEARPDWDVTLLGRIADMRRHGWDGWPTVTLRDCRSRIYTIAEQVELRLRIPRDADLFWSPHYNIPLAYRGRLVVTVHDLFHLAMPEFAPQLAQQAYARVMFGTVGRRADAIVCDSEFTRRELCRLVPRVRARPAVIHLGVDESWRRDRAGVSPWPRPYVLYVGNVKPHKNLVSLIAAFDIIRDRVPHDLVIVGRREGMRTADERVEEVADALGGRVAFTGELPLEELRRYVAWADAAVTPSLYEGFGLPPLEAMASGCPTLVARAGSLPEVCGDAALYCDPRDVRDIGAQLQALLQDDALRDSLRERGRQHAAQFTWERCADQTLAVLDAAVRR